MFFKKYILPVLGISSLLLAPLHAASFSDDFNRANTTSGLGPNWEAPSTVYLNSKVAKTQTRAIQLVLCKSLELNKTFEVSVNAYAQDNSKWFGVIVNYKDAKNYYIFRAKFDAPEAPTPWQFVKVINGSSPKLIDEGAIAAGSMTKNTWRAFKVASGSTPGEFTFTIATPDGSKIFLNTTVADSSLPNGGEAGFVFNTAYMWASNFSIETAP